MHERGLNIDDPQWDPRDKLAYLTDLLDRGVPAMRENRGKLIDVQGSDRSDLIPQGTDGDISPLLPETMEQTAAYLQMLIEQTRQQFFAENTLFEHIRAQREME